jgi:hypothetical protein
VDLFTRNNVVHPITPKKGVDAGVAAAALGSGGAGGVAVGGAVDSAVGSAADSVVGQSVRVRTSNGTRHAGANAPKPGYAWSSSRPSTSSTSSSNAPCTPPVRCGSSS